MNALLIVFSGLLGAFWHRVVLPFVKLEEHSVNSKILSKFGEKLNSDL